MKSKNAKPTKDAIIDILANYLNMVLSGTPAKMSHPYFLINTMSGRIDRVLPEMEAEIDDWIKKGAQERSAANV